MRVEKFQNNNNYKTSFGIKLVLRKVVYPHNVLEDPSPEVLKRLVQEVETRTAEQRGTMYIPGFWSAWSSKPENMNIYFEHGSYYDGVTLYGVYKEYYQQNTDNFAKMLIELANVFKIRESVVRATEKKRRRIAKLQAQVEQEFKALSDSDSVNNFENKHRTNFANNVLEGDSSGLDPNGKNFQSLRSAFIRDKKSQQQFLANV